MTSFLSYSESIDSFLADMARATVVAAERKVPSVAAGLVVAKRYRLKRPLGRGAHGIVWIAEDGVAKQDVAIKLLFPGSPEMSTRIRGEISALRSLRVPGAVSLLDEGLEGGFVFIVMPLVIGAPFPGVRTPAAWRDLEPLVMSLLETLSGVHALGIVHRDLKPGNVLVRSDGAPCVLDFGLSAPAFYAPADPLDRIAGTPAYLAPEQVEAGPVDHRADLYALGAMLFQAISGRLPHEGTEVRAILAAKFRPPPPVRDLVPSLSLRVASVIDSLLATNPNARPPSASEVARLLAERSSELPASGWPAALVGTPAPLSVAEISELFSPSHGFASVAEDAGVLLHALTGGDRVRLRQELERWLEGRVIRWELGPGSRFVIDRFALDRLEARRRLAELADARGTGPALALARSVAEEGRLGLAMAVAQELLWRSPRPPTAELESILSLAVEVALAEGAPETIDRVLYELCRVGPLSKHLQSLESLTRAALAVGPWTERALDLASEIEPLADPALERWRNSIRVVAARRTSIEREESVLEELAASPEAHRDEVARGTLAGWLGRLRYRQGRFLEAAAQHQIAAEAPLWLTARADALLSAAAALMEAFHHREAAVLLESALDFFVEARHARNRALALWLMRTIAYRRGEQLTVDRAWIERVELLGSREIEGLAYITEASIAWRTGELDIGAEYARRARRGWAGMGEDAGAGHLASALLMVMTAADGIDAEAAARLARDAARCATPGIGIQVVGLLAGLGLDVCPRELEERLAA
ncbi:MAG: serine/threonine protein kinase, partial [Myxococcales bacterium]|nr:serine/threonine protein kinase [Myxococcales bacterium]